MSEKTMQELADEIAIAAMQGLLAYDGSRGLDNPADTSFLAYRYACAMLEERAKIPLKHNTIAYLPIETT
jgi:hypothetical protein